MGSAGYSGHTPARPYTTQRTLFEGRPALPRRCAPRFSLRSAATMHSGASAWRSQVLHVFRTSQRKPSKNCPSAFLLCCIVPCAAKQLDPRSGCISAANEAVPSANADPTSGRTREGLQPRSEQWAVWLAPCLKNGPFPKCVQQGWVQRGCSGAAAPRFQTVWLWGVNSDGGNCNVGWGGGFPTLPSAPGGGTPLPIAAA